MSTTNQTTAPTTPQAAPPPPPPDTGNLRFAKISSGEIKTRPNKNEPWEVLPELMGRFTGCRIHVGDNNGKEIVSFEVDIEAEGAPKTVVGVSMESKVASGQLGAAVLNLAEGEYVCIRTSLSKDPTPQGSHMTFVSVQRYSFEAQSWSKVEADRRKFGGAESWADAHEEVFEQVLSHPAYKERKKHSDAGDGFQRFNQATLEKSKIFPLLMASAESQAAYLDWINKTLEDNYEFEGQYLDFGDVSSEHWEALIEAVNFVKVTPKVLKPFLS